MHKIDELLKVNATRVKNEGDFWFDIPKRDVESLDYSYCLAMPLLRRGHTARRSFKNRNTKHQACLTAWLLNHLYEAVKGKYNLTQREIYYNNKLLFQNPDAVDKALVDICCLLGCTATSLNVIPRPKGTAIGKLVLKMSGKNKDVDFSDDSLIPFDIREIDQFVMDKSVEFILVVEKGTMFDHLVRVGSHETHKCVIVCGHGVPDERTRGFVRMLEERFDIPIYGITDPDSYGSSIMKVYAKGSINLAHCNMSLAANSIHWLGICTLDIANMRSDAGKKVRRRCAKLEAKEIKMLLNMKTPKYGLSTLWIQRIDDMLYWSRKCCFEDLNVLGRDFATSVHIPYLITRVKNNMQQINGNGSPPSFDPLMVPSSEKVPAVQFDELKQKMKGFGPDALVDEGPYGRLYRAALEDGKYMTVKRLNPLPGPQPNKEFLEHVNIVSTLRHENFVELLGYCNEGDECLLVYESSTMGSLHDILHGKKEQTSVLDWNQRVKIAVDVARGLEHLHEKAQVSIVHGDIHSSNVLLFGNYKAKISDFKLPNQRPVDLRNQGYHAPDFGVVLLELLTGRNPADKVQGGQGLISWATQRIQQGKVLQTVDPKLKRLYDAVEVTKLAEVAALCLGTEPESRPSMSTVVNQLSSPGQKPELPRRI